MRKINAKNCDVLTLIYFRVCTVSFASNITDFIYIYGSVHRESNLITVQQDATYSVYYISVGNSTCFGC